MVLELEDTDALCRRGKEYFEGDGVQQDYTEAFRLFSLAAEHGNIHAKAFLTRMFQSVESVKRELSQVVKWFRIAVEEGDDTAHYILFWFSVNWRIQMFELVYKHGGIHHAQATEKLPGSGQSIHSQKAPC